MTPGKWAGTRELKTPCKPIPYAQKRKDGSKIKVRDRAEAAAHFFEFDIWNNKNPTGITKGEKDIKLKLHYKTGIITKEELDQVLKTFKNRKAPGPDEIPMGFFKELSDVKKEVLRELINDWWTKENIPEEQLKARVVLTLKKR